jgi:hypothetical protein
MTKRHIKAVLMDPVKNFKKIAFALDVSRALRYIISSAT